MSRLNRKALKRNKLSKKLIPNTQEAPCDDLDFKVDSCPPLKKIQSLAIAPVARKSKKKDVPSNINEKLQNRLHDIVSSNAIKDANNSQQNESIKKKLDFTKEIKDKEEQRHLNNQLLKTSALTGIEKYQKGRLLLVLEPSQKQEFFIVRLKEWLSKKRGMAFVDFYDRCTPDDGFALKFSLQEEGIVQWDNVICELNQPVSASFNSQDIKELKLRAIRIKNTEIVHEIKFTEKLSKEIYKVTGMSNDSKRDKKAKQKEEEDKYEDNYAPSGSDSDDESFDLLPSDDDEDKGKKKAAKGKMKKVRRPKKSAGQKAAEEQKKRQTAEEIDRQLNPDYKESGIRIVKSRIADDGVSEEIVEVDPTVREIRPKNWKFITREEEDKKAIIIDQEIMRFGTSSNLIYLEDSMTTANRNIIRAALTDNAELAKECIDKVKYLSSLMETWSPELKSTAIELAISNNSRKVLEVLLAASQQIETDYRCKEQALLMTKFDTGQVSDRAFGTRVRKVEMMRGGRQGNNAFMQTIKRNEEYKCILDQLLKDEILAVRAAYSCNIEIDTLKLIYDILKDDSLPFFKEIFYHILRTGRRHLAAEWLDIMRQSGSNSIFAETDVQDMSILDQMIEILRLEKLSVKDIDRFNNLDKTHSYQGVTYLHMACVNPNLFSLVQRLIQNGHSIDVKDKLGATPIFYASVNPEPACLGYFVEEHKQYLRVYDKKNNTPLLMAIIGRRCEIIHYILQLSPSAIKDKSILRMTPLNVACRNGSIATVRTIMSYKGSAPNQPGGWDKLTPLCYASAYGYYELAEFLLTFTKWKIDKGDKFGRTPLMLSCRNGHVKIASLLLRFGAKVKDHDTSGNTALHYAAAYGYPECVDLLLDNLADVNSENLWKSTPLSIAMLKRNLLCVSQLLDRADKLTSIKDDNGNTLLSIAIESMNKTNIHLFDKIVKDADPNIPDAQGNTPLMKVIYRIVEKRKQKSSKKAKNPYKLEISVAKKLIEKGADSAIKNKAGQNALTFLISKNSYSNNISDSKNISELIGLLWQNFSFFKDPKSFFSFNENILSLDTQVMIIALIEQSIKTNKNNKEECKSEIRDVEMANDEEEEIKLNSNQLPYSVINVLDEDGFSPFLRYIDVFSQQWRQIYDKVEKHMISQNITKEEQLDAIDISKLLDSSNNNPFALQNNNGGLFGSFGGGGGLFGGAGSFGNNVNKQKELALKLIDTKISQPFAQFLDQLVHFGADKHLTVEKTQYFRDSTDDVPIIRKRDSFGNVKDQYCEKGLSNALHLILEFPSQTIFDFLLDSGVSSEEINIKKMTPFFMLIKTKDTNAPEYKYCLDKFISTKADIDSPDQFGVSAFWHCYQNQKVELALYLASKGADINRIDNYGFFALKSEVFNNNLDRIRQLVVLGADVNKQDEFQRTVLHHSFNRYRVGNDLGIIKYLLGNSANVNEKDFKKRTPLHYLFVKSNRRFITEQNDPVDVIIQVVNQGVAINFEQQDNNGNTILHYMCQRQAIECFKLLKTSIKNTDFDIINNDGNTPLAIALISKNKSVISEIINNFNVDLNGYCFEPTQGNNQGGNNVQGEESDFEFMMTMDIQQEQNENLNKFKKRKSYFEYCLNIQELNSVVKQLLEKGYSISNAFKDAFKAGNYQQLFQLLKSMDQDTVKEAVKIKDAVGRNIFHGLSKAPDGSPFNDIWNILITEYNWDPCEVDNQGNSPIMLACQEGKINLVKALECVGCDIKSTNNKNENCIHLLMKGKRIKKYNRKLLLYLINSGVNFSSTYQEDEYLPSKSNEDDEDTASNIIYRCTPLIHIIKTELVETWDKADLLDEIFEQSEQRIDVNEPDSDGRDVFMHMAILNEFEVCKYLIKKIVINDNKLNNNKNGIELPVIKLDGEKYHNKAVWMQEADKKIPEDEEEETIITNKNELKLIESSKNDSNKDKTLETNYKYGINLQRVCKNGKSVVHYIVVPVSYGSYENYSFLQYILKMGFKGDIIDNDGNKPYQYAIHQSTGVLLEVFQEFKIAPETAKIDSNLKWYKKIQDWTSIDYQKDAQDFLDMAKMNVDKENLVPCDSVGKFNDDWVVYEDTEKGYYDCHLTRVDIGREEKDDYLFYKLQIVHDKGRDLWILFTRWGRIGEEGAFQKTPYTKDECIKEYESIFLKKTKNEWAERSNFKKHWFKYQLVNVNYSNVSHEDYLVPFDFVNSKESELHSSVREGLKEMTQVAMYVKGLKDSGIDLAKMPFSNINRNDIQKARKSLAKLREILEELEPMEANLNRFDKAGKDKIISLRESMWYHSSRFYELIPHEEFKDEIVPPIKQMAMLKQKSDMIDNLMNFEMASKILLGAHKNAKEINPLDYCMKAMDVDINTLDKQSDEFKILKEYCVRTWPENKQASRKIRNIFKIERKGEGEAYEAYEDLENKYLLFHGTRISNFMGIMSQGLRVAPPEAPKTGYMFGKGVYLADMLQKSYNYCSDHNASPDCSKFMILCEAALGVSYKLTHSEYMDEPPKGYDSTQGLGRMGPDYSKCFTFPEGYKIPRGKYLEYEYDEKIQNNVYLNHNEYIIYKNSGNKISPIKGLEKSETNPGQIKMRYIIQLK